MKSKNDFSYGVTGYIFLASELDGMIIIVNYASWLISWFLNLVICRLDDTVS